MTPIKVLLVDDHTMLRQGIRALLAPEPDIEVVGEAGDAREAIALAEAARPDVVLMDITLPGLDGVTAARRFKERWPDVRVVMLTMHRDEELVRRSVAAGASGYLLKSAGHDELVEALRLVVRREVVLLPAGVTGRGPGLDEAPYRPRVRELLTPREREVLDLLCEGLSNREIARRLFLSEYTVKSHLYRIDAKLGVGDRTQAVALVLGDKR